MHLLIGNAPIEKGKVIDDDMPENIFTRGNELSKVGLDVPYPERLKHELAKLGSLLPYSNVALKQLTLLGPQDQAY